MYIKIFFSFTVGGMDKDDRHITISTLEIRSETLSHILHNIFPGMHPVLNVSSNHFFGKTIQQAVSLNYWEAYPDFQLNPGHTAL